ncbi:hypothetical protein COBT_002580 [Conglomerata obtusa]
MIFVFFLTFFCANTINNKVERGKNGKMSIKRFLCCRQSFSDSEIYDNPFIMQKKIRNLKKIKPMVTDRESVNFAEFIFGKIADENVSQASMSNYTSIKNKIPKKKIDNNEKCIKKPIIKTVKVVDGFNNAKTCIEKPNINHIKVAGNFNNNEECVDNFVHVKSLKMKTLHPTLFSKKESYKNQ